MAVQNFRGAEGEVGGKRGGLERLLFIRLGGR